MCEGSGEARRAPKSSIMKNWRGGILLSETWGETRGGPVCVYIGVTDLCACVCVGGEKDRETERVIRAERNGEGASESKIASSLNDVGWYDKATSMGLTRNTLGDGSRVNMPAQWLLFS